MKYFLLLFCVCCLSLTNPISANEKETEKVATFIKIWGFLKYYHPTVAQGKIDWDETFRTGLTTIQTLHSKEAINAYYLEWIEKLGTVRKCNSCQMEMDGEKKFNLDMSWLRNTDTFNEALIAKLVYIQYNRNQKPNHYVSVTKVGNPVFSNEKKYKDSIFPSPELRLLTLARYWNIIHYLFPYRYQTDQPWEMVLQEMIPKFSEAPNVLSYHLAILELTAKIDDSHAKFSTPYINQHFGLKWPPFKVRLIEDKAVVVGFYNDSLARAHDIRVGDVFLSIDKRSIQQLFDENSKYIGASNKSVKQRDIPVLLFNGSTDTVETEYERGGVIGKKTIPRVPFKQLGYTWGQDNSRDTIKILEGNIGYVHMGNLTVSQVPRLIAQLKETKAIVFDVRNYPKSTLYAVADFLNSQPTPFVKVTTPDLTYPGNFRFARELYCGKKNPNAYKGQVILLCDETSQSHAEFTLMALQTAPGATIVGSQTSGADGNASLVTLPGNFQTYITGLGIFYPDGRETQRIGIVPDVLVKPTLRGIREGRDEVLEKALQLISQDNPFPGRP